MLLTEFESFTFFPGQHWSHTWERQHELITRFASELPEREIQVGPPLGLINHNPISLSFIKRYFSYRKNQKGENIQNPLLGNMNLINGFHLPFHNSLIGKINYRLLEKKMKMSPKNFFWATYMNPTLYEFFQRSTFKVYDLAERRLTNPALTSRIISLEKKAVSEADIVFVDNHATYEDYKNLNSQIYYIPQGVNCDTFFETSFSKNERKYIGYIGNLHFAIDYSFLTSLIISNPEEKFLIIGGILEKEGYEIIKLPNVTYIDQIPKKELNKYLAQMKVGLIPYVVNDHTIGVYPTKLFEYLSARVPVLSTPLPEVVQYVNDDYLKIIHNPISLKNLEFNMEKSDILVSNNTWDIRWNEYIKLIKLCLE